jgi:transposase
MSAGKKQLFLYRRQWIILESIKQKIGLFLPPLVYTQKLKQKADLFFFIDCKVFRITYIEGRCFVS